MDVPVDILSSSGLFTIQILGWGLHQFVISRAARRRVVLLLGLPSEYRAAVAIKTFHITASGGRSRDSVVHF